MNTHWSIRRTDRREAQINAIERATGLDGVTEVFDYCLSAVYTQEVNQMTEYIQVQYSADSLSDEQDISPEAAQEYGDALQHELERQYPDADVSVEMGISNSYRVNGQPDHDEAPFIEQIAHDVWMNWLEQFEDA